MLLSRGKYVFAVGPGRGTMVKRKFLLFLIKPSHYDDDGYVIQWMRSAIPSNTLAALYGLALDCRERQVLGRRRRARHLRASTRPTRASAPTRIARAIAAAGGLGLVALVGVQSNQFPRAMDIARPLRARRRPGRDRRLPRVGLPRHAARNAGRPAGGARPGISLFAGEAEGRLDVVLRDAAAGTAEADLQLHGRPAGDRGRRRAAAAGRADRAHRRPADELRCRPRLPVPVLVLHDHQRAGPQVALPHARRRRGAHPRATSPRASTISSSPTTISPATELGADLRPADRRCARRRGCSSASSSRSTRSATGSRTSSTRRPAPA